MTHYADPSVVHGGACCICGEWFDDNEEDLDENDVCDVCAEEVEAEPVCVNAHDRCYEGGPCPYCETPLTLVSPPARDWFGIATDITGAAR